jgi:hypothetical protein
MRLSDQRATLAPSHENRFGIEDPFKLVILQVILLDLHEEGSGCMPFIAVTTILAPTTRREFLLRASDTLFEFFDEPGAAECLKHALGLQRVGPSEELDLIIKAGLQKRAEMARANEADDPEKVTRKMEFALEVIREIHRARRDRVWSETSSPCHIRKWVTEAISQAESCPGVS